MKKIISGSEALFTGVLAFLGGRRQLAVGVLEGWIERKGAVGTVLYVTQHCCRGEGVEARVWMEKSTRRGVPVLVRRVEFRLKRLPQRQRQEQKAAA